MKKKRPGRVTLLACPECQDTPYPHYDCDQEPTPVVRRYYKADDAWWVKLGRAAVLGCGALLLGGVLCAALKSLGAF